MDTGLFMGRKETDLLTKPNGDAYFGMDCASPNFHGAGQNPSP